MNIWRINLKSDGVNPREFCLKRNIVGVGWPVDHTNNTLVWKEYYELAMETYYNQPERDKGWWPALNAMKNRMVIGDLVWTRDTKGEYYLGRITSDWRYDTSGEYRDADMVNIRSCEWLCQQQLLI